MGGRKRFFFEKKNQKTFAPPPGPAAVGLACLLFALRVQAQEAAPAPPPPTDTVLPRSGVDPTLSDLREHLLNAYGDTQPAPRGVSAPNLQITGELGISEEFTSNAGLAAGGRVRGSDFITAIQPGITVIDTSQRLQVNATYRPISEIYAENSDFSQFEQQGNGSITFTALPGWLFLDARGAVSQQSVFGGVGPGTTTTLSPSERETVSSFSASPYVVRQFGGLGTVQAGVSYSYSATDAPSLVNPALTSPLALALLQSEGLYGSSSLATKRAYANVTSGENYGRLQDRAGIDASFYTGTGAQADGRRVLVTDDLSYAVSRFVTALAEAGYENLNYPRSRFAYAGVVGYGGARLTPNQSSTLTLEYRYVDGFGSVYAQGSVQATARIRIFGGYSEGISTQDQDLQNSLLDSTGLATGVGASALQAAPLLAGASAFAGNQNLNRTHRLDLTASWVANYDTVTLALHRDTTTEVGRPLYLQPNVRATLNTSGTFGTLSESHALTPDLTLDATVEYGSNQSGLAGNSSGETLGVSVGLQKSFPRNLSAYIRAGGNYFVGGSAIAAAGTRGQSGDQTTLIIGGRKTF